MHALVALKQLAIVVPFNFRRLVTIPHGPGWPSVHLTPPLHSFGSAALIGATSPYQRLPFFYNSYLFSPLNYRFPAHNPYLKYLEENHAKSSQKDISLEKIENKKISKNKINEIDNSASQSKVVANFLLQPNSEIIDKSGQKEVWIQKSVEMEVSSEGNKTALSNETLVALAQFNEKQKHLKSSERLTAKTNGVPNKSKPSSKVAQSKPKKEEKVNQLKNQVEQFETEDQLDIQTNETRLKNMKIVENLIKKLEKKKNNHESLVLNDVRLKKEDNVPQKLVDPNAAFFAPYKNHPLFTYLRGKHTIDSSKLIQFKGEENNLEKDTVTLILKPMARAVAGLEGRAVATPLSRAVVERGTNADILFEPDAIAIVGPGGIAHAQSELEVGYVV